MELFLEVIHVTLRRERVRLTGGHDVFSEMYNHVVTIGPFEEDVCIIKLVFIKMLLLQAHYYNAVILYRSYFYAERALPGNVLAHPFSSTGMIGHDVLSSTFLTLCYEEKGFGLTSFLLQGRHDAFS
jgi:hypothetical protein